MSGISCVVTLVEHVPVHLTVVVHVPSFVIFAVSLRSLFLGAPIHSESSVEVAARSSDGSQAHHFLNKPLALRRHPCLPLLSWVHLHRSLAQHIPPFLVNDDPSYFSIQYIRISQVFGPHRSVIKMLLCPLQSSRHVFCVEARYITLAHLAPAGCFTRIIHSWYTIRSYLFSL